MNRKVYIDLKLNFYWHQILLKVHFGDVQILIKFYRTFQMFNLGRFFPKYRKKKCYFFNNIFRKFIIVVCFAPLLLGVERNTIFVFNSITDSVKSEKTWKRKLATRKPEVGGEFCLWHQHGTYFAVKWSQVIQFFHILLILKLKIIVKEKFH